MNTDELQLVVRGELLGGKLSKLVKLVRCARPFLAGLIDVRLAIPLIFWAVSVSDSFPLPGIKCRSLSCRSTVFGLAWRYQSTKIVLVLIPRKKVIRSCSGNYNLKDSPLLAPKVSAERSSSLVLLGLGLRNVAVRTSSPNLFSASSREAPTNETSIAARKALVSTPSVQLSSRMLTG